MACSLLKRKVIWGLRRRTNAEHRSTGKMSPRLILPKHKVRAGSCLVNNLNNCSGKKPAAAAISLWRKKKNLGDCKKNRKMPDRNSGRAQKWRAGANQRFLPWYIEDKPKVKDTLHLISANQATNVLYRGVSTRSRGEAWTSSWSLA